MIQVFQILRINSEEEMESKKREFTMDELMEYDESSFNVMDSFEISFSDASQYWFIKTATEEKEPRFGWSIAEIIDLPEDDPDDPGGVDYKELTIYEGTLLEAVNWLLDKLNNRFGDN